MTNTSDAMLKLIHETTALSIWNRKKGPVFWYILGVPGPFYFNIELMIGKEASAKLLQAITDILAATNDLAERAEELNKAVMGAYASNQAFKDIVTSMVMKLKEQNVDLSKAFISGGERRDWFFSIPLAAELKLSHVFLFKDQRIFCSEKLEEGQPVLHVADLINNAASYFDKWLPALEKAKLPCLGTICVVSRGPGAKKLEAAGVKVYPLVDIDLSFFERSKDNGLIDQERLTEIATHFQSPKEWATTYLFGDRSIFNVSGADAKSFERLESFFTNDPWGLETSYPDLFHAMRDEVAQRHNKAA